MCGVTPIMAIASLATSVMSQQQQVRAKKTSLRVQQQQSAYQAQIARNNHKVAEWQARDALKQGREAELAYRRKTGQLKGRQRAVLAASGFQVNDDDPIEILGDTAEIGETEALTIRRNAGRQAFGYRQNAANAVAQARMQDFNATVTANRAAAISPFLASGSTLFSGIGSIKNKWRVA